MPGGDRTGPSGMGPMTGRRAGYCTGYSTPGAVNQMFGRGYGGCLGRGLGFGFRGGRRAGWVGPYGQWGATLPAAFGRGPSFQNEVEALKAEAEYLKSSLKAIEKRMTELEGSKASE